VEKKVEKCKRYHEKYRNRIYKKCGKNGGKQFMRKNMGKI